MPSDKIESYLARSRELRAAGLSSIHASGLADLETRIKEWPAGWGDNLEIIIYGDFEPLESALELPNLGIVVHPGNLENTFIKAGLTVHKATVSIKEKLIDSLIEATHRINIFLGSFSLVNLGNISCWWWSGMMHDTQTAMGSSLLHADLPNCVVALLAMTYNKKLEPTGRKVRAALYWLRVPRKTVKEHYKSDILQTYAAYWNAFECLVEAVLTLFPYQKLNRAEKQLAIEQLFESHGHKISADFVQAAYLQIVRPGLAAKATHALQVCFGKKAAQHYTNECFQLSEEGQRLYNIRNAINHGEIDGENPREVIRIEARLLKLTMMILGMFGCLLPVKFPYDSEAYGGHPSK